MHQHAVGRAVHMGERMALRHQGWVHAQLHRVIAAAAGDGQQLDGVAQLGGGGDVCALQIADALDMHGVEIHRHVERVGGQQTELVGGVDAVHVERGIGLGIAAPLRLGQRGVEAQACIAHAGEDVIAGAVQNAGDRVDAVGGQCLAQRFDDGNAARHCGFVGELAAMCLCGGGQFFPMQRQKRLVGGDHVLACGERGPHPVARGAGAACHFDQHVHIGMGCHVVRVVGELDGSQRRAAELFCRTCAVAHGDGDDLHAAPRAGGNQRLIALQHGPCAQAHRAQPDHANAQCGRRCGHRCSSLRGGVQWDGAKAWFAVHGEGPLQKSLNKIAVHKAEKQKTQLASWVVRHWGGG
ncbi:hypothetical protein SDC9_96159 [bioreactor metagenome]|uniref:Uncharacterized protein n=1 Tax=bioreactor metagenome TaxID=1076179 RepID=A0A645A8C3_9ZZZZ